MTRTSRARILPLTLAKEPGDACGRGKKGRLKTPPSVETYSCKVDVLSTVWPTSAMSVIRALLVRYARQILGAILKRGALERVRYRDARALGPLEGPNRLVKLVPSNEDEGNENIEHRRLRSRSDGLIPGLGFESS